MARMSIYIPDDLKARMDAVGDQLNWSEIVRPALQAAVANREHRRGNMTSAIERLRASKEEYTAQDRAEGEKTGRDWAENDADWDELRRVSKLEFGYVTDGALAALDKTLNPQGEMSREEFLERYFGDPDAYVSDECAVGWIDGAQAFFAEVRDKL